MILDHIQGVRQTGPVCFSIQAVYFEQGPNERPDKKGLRCKHLLSSFRLTDMLGPNERPLRFANSRHGSASRLPEADSPSAARPASWLDDCRNKRLASRGRMLEVA